MSSDARWIADRAALAEELGRIGAGPLGLDTEADSFHHYREKVCLVQLSHPGGHALIDALAGIDLAPLGPLLGDGALRKILHGADYDVRLLHRDFGLCVEGLFDTMVAARLVGERQYGLAALLERYLGVALDKSLQRADWSQRPLSAAMRDYAVCDTRHLEVLCEKLEQKLQELGRTAWAEQEFRELEQVRWNEREDDGTAFSRLRGAPGLDRRGLAVLREVWGLRDELARARDLAPFRVLSNDALVALAQRPPADVGGLAGRPELPRRWQERDLGDRLLGAVRRALALPEAEWPSPVEGRGRPVEDPALERAWRRLRDERDRLADRLGIEASLLGSRAELVEVIEHRRRGEAWEASGLLRDWQIELLAPLVAKLPA